MLYVQWHSSDAEWNLFCASPVNCHAHVHFEHRVIYFQKSSQRAAFDDVIFSSGMTVFYVFPTRKKIACWLGILGILIRVSCLSGIDISHPQILQKANIHCYFLVLRLIRWSWLSLPWVLWCHPDHWTLCNAMKELEAWIFIRHLLW